MVMTHNNVAMYSQQTFLHNWKPLSVHSYSLAIVMHIRMVGHAGAFEMARLFNFFISMSLVQYVSPLNYIRDCGSTLYVGLVR